MPRVLFTIRYLGTRYAGWQTQTNAVGVQQVIEEALSTLCKQPIKIEGAGRTDAGVHARGQRAHADLPIEIEGRGILLGVNNLLPRDIRMVDVEPVAPDFHSRFNARRKTYIYQIWNSPIADPFVDATHAYVPQRLDFERMTESARSLVGLHDFRSFTVANPKVATTWRTIFSADLDTDGDTIRFTVTADGFLRFMVRRMVGSLLEVGHGKQPVDIVEKALEPGFRPARWTAPANGLILANVEYG